MPAKNRLKEYVEGGVYHVYNRGVLKQDIFLDDHDYCAFLSLLKYYLSPVLPTSHNREHPFQKSGYVKLIRPRPLANINKEVELLCYCLMPNHFHLLLRQITVDGMQKLMRRISTTYAMGFNKRYKKSGYVFQGRYKAALIDMDEYLLHVSRYIHLNPVKLELTRTVPVSEYPYSSYAYYLRKKSARWLKPELILDHFKHQSYRSFIDDYQGISENILGGLVLDDDE
ncbi:transposase [Patescibacteria group bacterium]|nr:transposase [Patescibacteria group bacterium]MBU1200512.1 transposase [Patescibacteria group bacterium]MBU1256270.1 transposase [Patescibacteria group bacterium]MBU1457708.1 transposase [Patescibacteria group bacterium]